MFDQVDFSALELPAPARALQQEVREFVRAEFAALLGFGFSGFVIEVHDGLK